MGVKVGVKVVGGLTCDCCKVGWPSLPESLISSIIQVYKLRKELTI